MPEPDIRDRVEELVVSLGRIRQVGLMYGEGHRIAKESVDTGYATLENILAERGEVTIGIIGDELAYEKEPFYEASLRMGEFIEHLKAIGMKKISFLKGTEKQEFYEFAKVLAMKIDTVTKGGGAQKLLELAGIMHITTGELGFGGGKGEKSEEELVNDLTKQNYENGIDFLEKAYEDIKGNKKLNVHSARQIVSGMISDIIKNKNLLLVLTSVRGRDENLFAHGMNVAVFTLMQAESLGIPKETMADVGMAALLHDVGKLAAKIQDDEEDMSEEGVKKKVIHDVLGAKMLLETDGISPLAAIVAFEHNIKYDMSGGGPKKLYGDELNFVSMMIAVSSYYDRLRKKPSYNLDGGPEKAYEDMMKMSGKDFHPDILNNFFSLVGIFPPGTLVELDNGEVALVVQTSLIDKKRPQVEILYAPGGDKYSDPKLVNLLEKDEKGKFKWTIVKSISPMDKFKVPENYT
jgi:putative nucleotidyltransferase with HDIG domain